MSAINTDGLLRAIQHVKPRSGGGGRVVMLTSGRRGEGVTNVVRSLVSAAGPEAVFALDLDLRRNQLARTFSEQKLTEASPGEFGDASFCTILDERGAPAAAGAFCFRRVGSSHVQVGVLDPRAIPAGGKVRLSRGAAYWAGVRAAGATMIVDGPAIEQGKASLAAARYMDAIILVVGSGEGAAPAALAAKRALDGIGAPIIGIVYSGACAPALAIERVFSR